MKGRPKQNNPKDKVKVKLWCFFAQSQMYLGANRVRDPSSRRSSEGPCRVRAHSTSSGCKVRGLHQFATKTFNVKDKR